MAKCHVGLEIHGSYMTLVGGYRCGVERAKCSDAGMGQKIDIENRRVIQYNVVSERGSPTKTKCVDVLGGEPWHTEITQVSLYAQHRQRRLVVS